MKEVPMTDDFLAQKRNQIDELDKKILSTLKERLSLMPEIARYKKDQGLTIHQPEREDKLIEERQILAKEMGIDDGFATKLFSLIITESKRVQKKENICSNF